VEMDIPEIPTGLPSHLLNRRPDILAAERQLHAQTARIGVAEALKYPQLNLAGDIGAQFSDVSTGFAGLAAQLFGPLFNSGANQRRVDVEIAQTEQLLNTYEQSFLTALREVEDALVAADTYEVEYDARIRQLAAARNASALSWVRYEGGMTSFLEFLDLQRSLFSSQLLASEAQQLRITSVVQLYQALGGGWTAAQDSVFTATTINE
jgi:multidrug efflux system outer membrane protein